MHTPQQNQDTFHNLPETFNKNSLKAYVPKEQSFTKLNFLKKIFLKFYLPKELSLAMVSHVFELDFVKDGLKQQFLTQI
ncbi:MAG: hypothetical protein LBP53_00920 [Candidatus Peribacteria bacterium]|jgi:hypothetical protein|nr:hypothetical protein [Candidatus Peribacteria bacterium]